MNNKLRIECADACLVESSQIVENGSGILSWVINLKERWMSYDCISGIIPETSESYIEYSFDNGCGLIDSIKLFNLGKTYHRLCEMEKDQLVVYFIPTDLLIKDKQLLASMVVGHENSK